MSFDHFYMTGLGVMAYGAIYLPFALFVSWLVYRWILSRLPRLWLRLVSAVALSGVIVTAPLWDVYAIGQEAGRLCKEQAGLRVYKTVETDGFVTGIVGRYWLERGFAYVEGGGRNGQKLRGAMHDGQFTLVEESEYRSHYGLQTGADHRVISRNFSRNSDRVIDLTTNDVLGELVTIFIFPGWFDSVFIGLTGTGSGFTPWHCGDEAPTGRAEKLTFRDVVLATLKPRNTVKRGTK